MKKAQKIYGLILASILLISSCDNTLQRNKDNAKTEIEQYALARQNNFDVDNWSIVCYIVEDGVNAISIAKNKPEIDTIVDDTKYDINLVPNKSGQLSSELENLIKADYLKEFGHELVYGEDSVNKFYGLYDGAAVFFLEGDAMVIKTIKISGVEFSHHNDWRIIVWKESVFYNLEDIDLIFEKGILTQDDVEQIGLVHSTRNA